LIAPEMDIIENGPRKYPSLWDAKTWKGHINHNFVSNLDQSLYSPPREPQPNLQIEFPNVTVPVCSTLIVNDNQVFRHDPPPYPHTKHFVNSLQESRTTLLGLDRVTRKYHLSACAIVRATGAPERVYLLRQWIEYHHMQGFEHFYIYDHDVECNGTNPPLYDALEPYIKQGLVTHIRFSVSRTIRKYPLSLLYYQHAQINSCLLRFQYESDFIADFDIDEWMFVNPYVNFSDTLIRQMVYRETNTNGSILPETMSKYREMQKEDQLKVLSKESRVVDMVDYMYETFGVNYFEVVRYIGATCYEELGCNKEQNKFWTYLDRSRCLIFEQRQPKFIVDPMLSKAAWIHYVEMVDNWLPFQPSDENDYYERKIEKKERRHLLSEMTKKDEQLKKTPVMHWNYPLLALHSSDHWDVDWEWKEVCPRKCWERYNLSYAEYYKAVSTNIPLLEDIISRYHEWLLDHAPDMLKNKQVLSWRSKDFSAC